MGGAADNTHSPESAKLPLLLSVPHAGLITPPELTSLSILSQDDIVRDGDVGAAEIYDLAEHVDAYVTTDIARAFVDLNREIDDRSPDGVVKTHTCWQVPVYKEPLPESLVAELLEKYYHPYHQRLRDLASSVIMGIDCHTMAAEGPPIGPDPGQARPAVCLGNADGTCPQEWIESLAKCMREIVHPEVTINEPFSGGFITRSHAQEMPWLQLEFSRAPFLPNQDKRKRLLQALTAWLKYQALK